MPTTIEKVEHIERVRVSHKCSTGRSEYWAHSDTLKDEQGVRLHQSFSRDFNWPHPDQTHCMSCGEKLPLNPEEVEKEVGT